MDQAKRNRRTERQQLIRRAADGLKSRTGTKAWARKYVDGLLKRVRLNQAQQSAQRVAAPQPADFQYKKSV